MTGSINSLLDFVSFTHDIRKIKRAMWVLDKEQFENDSEHGFQLALVALYIIEENKLNLDPYKSMAMALVHDIIEVHSGDTSVFGNKTDLDSKNAREQEAIATLKKQWPRLNLMHKLIDEYEHKLSAESRFVYALDKLVPMLNNYLDNGRNWKRDGINLDQVITVKTNKIDIDDNINDYYKELLVLIKNKPELFA